MEAFYEAHAVNGRAFVDPPRVWLAQFPPGLYSVCYSDRDGIRVVEPECAMGWVYRAARQLYAWQYRETRPT